MSDGANRSDTKAPGSSSQAPSPAVARGNPKLQQLFARITEEIEEKQPENVIYFIVDFLCKHYPDHLGGFAAIWNDDVDLERDRLQVIEFFRFQKLPVKIAKQFISVGFDTLETLCTVTQEHLPCIERDSNASWLQGHRVRLLQTFSDVCNRVRAFRQEREKLLHIARLTSGHCEHPVIVTRTNAPHMRALPTSVGPNPLPNVRVLPVSPPVHHVVPPPMSGATLNPVTSSRYAATKPPLANNVDQNDASFSHRSRISNARGPQLRYVHRVYDVVFCDNNSRNNGEMPNTVLQNA